MNKNQHSCVDYCPNQNVLINCPKQHILINFHVGLDIVFFNSVTKQTSKFMATDHRER